MRYEEDIFKIHYTQKVEESNYRVANGRGDNKDDKFKRNA